MSKTVLVTGGTRGIGHAISAAMVKAGYKVAANYAGNEEAAKATAAELGIHVYKFDVADYDAVGAGIAAIEAELGPIDIVVNNAGVTRDAPFHKMTKDQWQQVIDIDLTSAFNVTRQVWEGMRDRNWGRVINISSRGGRTVSPVASAHYAATKSGLIGFTRIAALEGASDNITANCVAPGPILSAMTAGSSPEVRAAFTRSVPLGRYGDPEEIASAVSFLASDASSFITGAIFDINGGTYMP